LDPSSFCFLYKNCNEDRIARKDSDNADLGLSKTARLLKDCFTPTTPINGIVVKLETSSVFCIELFIKKIKNTIDNGINKPRKIAIT
jgi:hypothetical protein